MGHLWICTLFLPFITTSSTLRGLRVCEYFNPSECLLNHSNCNQTKICSEDGDGKWHCYALWTNISGSPTILMKGCWFNKEYCYDRHRCSIAEINKENNFCCCDSDMCNSDVDFEVIWSGNTKTSIINTSFMSQDSNSGMAKTLVISLCPLIVLAITIIIIFYIWRKVTFKTSGYKAPSFQAVIVGDKVVLSDNSKIQLNEVLANGCFSHIWKGRIDDKEVAVKILNEKGKKLWSVEKEFYDLFDLTKQHKNILKFIGAEVHQVNDFERGQIYSEYWLVTEFHPKGSLYDNLKCQTFSLNEVIKIAFSISKGLAFLHSPSNYPKKPSVAHRDLKTRNILLKDDTCACISDFGLSLVLEQNLNIVHGQVGSVRYMAPEVLDGSIHLNIESFLKIDVYSCSLILWELLSRCSTAEGLVGDYLMPYEKEIGLHPTIESMQNLVMHRKIRPHLKQEWWEGEITREFCRTIEECWDHDADARLTAPAVEHRFFQLYKDLPHSSNL